MDVRRTRRSLVLAAVALLAALAVASPGVAFAKSFVMPEVRIDARVGADGSLSVQEQRSFEFSGDYTRVYWDLEPPAGGAIQDISVTGPSGLVPPATAEGRPAGYSRVLQNGTLTQVDVYGAWSNETVAYTLSYKVTNAAVRWADTAELYWQAIAGHWSASTRSVTVTVRPPAGATKDQVKAWAHGPLTGDVAINGDGSVTLTLSDLPANTFVEPRILFPADALAQVTPGSEPKLASILAEEAKLANDANAQRQTARVAVFFFGALGIGIPLLFLAIVVAMFFRFGKEYRPTFQGEYFREPPVEMSPALVGYLWTMGSVEDQALSACLMDLADKGVIRMEPTTFTKPGLFGSRDESTYLLTLDTSKWESLDGIAKQLLSFLFTTVAGDDTLTIAEMQDYAKASAQEFQDGLNAVKAAVSAEADARGYVESGSRTAMAFSWLMTILAIGVAIWGMGASESIVVGLVAAPAIVAMIVLSAKMKRRSPAAAELQAKYVGLRNFLRDFSRLNEAPPASVVLWNQFLVLAVVFGIAQQVIEQMKVVVPQVVGDPSFAMTYWWLASGPGYGSPISSLSGGFTSAAQVASSTLSSASGGGGGFSGGGGGGFGGGGGGGAD
jgi:uncharacterized membrane protein